MLAICVRLALLSSLASVVAECDDQEALTNFRNAVRAYYKSNLPALHLSLYLPLFLNAPVEDCREGALLAHLIKIEESMYTHPETAFALFHEYLHHYSYSRNLESEPLFQIGVQRIHKVLKHNYGAAYCHDEVLSPEPSLRAACALLRNSIGLGREMRKSVDVAVCFCDADLHWLQELVARDGIDRVFIYAKCGLRPLNGTWAVQPDMITVDEAMRADDCTAYLTHIVRHYDDLGDYTIFLHDDAPEHILPSMRLLDDVLRAASLGSLDVPFLFLSHNFLDLNTTKYCCVQFVVARRRIRLRPWQFYANALNHFLDPQSYYQLFPVKKAFKYDTICRTPCQFFMPWWHIVFGQNLTSFVRSRDRSLPLFLQIRGVAINELICC
eukprot:GEMP01064307.1.p1 GENE.GEMP01064307.1~~GEMP01064307.1.p1  ORF type:complete len:383 (+),score=54.86 GEMP01064307.1:158-1306(+)